ncbi:LysR family transcriptional regulator [Pseudomonas lijiangensis]|uniref:LysR family transcriptional regulator n=1 Tax=Pseudomonas lijiangensis TaxID=2995658 RepID=A0ABX8HRU3_9PSED|nr:MULTISPECIES: LysR family transcriptional regulator [Pseudomonas syringae group]MBX8492200.1 LysR family transcriptional regulator [Pseudomonas cichorii]MBX8502554.1 LysR family transcriptional regulator [Pseudomonas lijiangensis]MBX8507502.1 LysR family transcriptional regulator [Pseudomonas lijiangensis]MBX8551207.1 LysR family transcriptional regulator [Pseudomonas cichorii]MBX8570601.1 LysR family transcriptional regulator [Pseudomonas cichorii]
MDIRTLKNLMQVAQCGSLTAASEICCLSVQALAAQLNKVEAQFGFKLFKRSNKGLTLTSAGQELEPYMEQVLEASRQLDNKVAALNVSSSRILRVALNSTLSSEVNRCIVARMIEAFDDCQLEFSYAESVENLSKLNHESFDMAVLIGPQSIRPSVLLPFVQVQVVGVHCGPKDTPLSSLNEKLQVRPSSSCPYSESFQRFIAGGTPKKGKPPSIVYSGSETLTLSLIRQLDGIGLVSRSVAEHSGLTIVPGFEDSLEVHLVVNNSSLSCQALNYVVHTALQDSADSNVGRHTQRHTEKQIPAQVCA